MYLGTDSDQSLKIIKTHSHCTLHAQFTFKNILHICNILAYYLKQVHIAIQFRYLNRLLSDYFLKRSIFYMVCLLLPGSAFLCPSIKLDQCCLEDIFTDINISLFKNKSFMLDEKTWRNFTKKKQNEKQKQNKIYEIIT